MFHFHFTDTRVSPSCSVELVPSLSYTGAVPALKYVSEVPSLSYTGAVPAMKYVSEVPSLSYTGAVPALKYVSEVPILSYTGAVPAMKHVSEVPSLSYTGAVPATQRQFISSMSVLTSKYIFQQIVSSFVRATRPAILNILLMFANILVMQHSPARCFTTDYYC